MTTYVQVHVAPTEHEKLIALIVDPAADPKGRPNGDVHEADCMIVLSRFPDSNWQEVDGPCTCGFCIERLGRGA